MFDKLHDEDLRKIRELKGKAEALSALSILATDALREIHLNGDAEPEAAAVAYTALLKVEVLALQLKDRPKLTVVA